MRGERAWVVSETKPPPGHAIFAQAARADVCSASPERRETDEREAAARRGRLLGVKDGVVQLQAALTCPDSTHEAVIQNRYSRSRCRFQEIHNTAAESWHVGQFINGLLLRLQCCKSEIYCSTAQMFGLHMVQH